MSENYVLIFIPGIDGGYNAHKEAKNGIYCAQASLPKLEAKGDTYYLKERLAFEVNDSASAPNFFKQLSEYQVTAHDVETVKIYLVSSKDNGKTKTLVKHSCITLYNYQMKTEVQDIIGVALIEFIVPTTVHKNKVPAISYTTSYEEEDKTTSAGPIIMVNSRNNTKETDALKCWNDELVPGIK